MDPHHRKIDLQSPADLLYLHSNIQSSATEKLNLALPPHAQDEDPKFRSRVSDLIQDYIKNTLTLALPSLAINGLNPDPALLFPAAASEEQQQQGQTLPPATPPANDPHYEAYDPRLAAQLRELYAQLESETTRVAELRRDAPGAAARAYVERLGREMEMEKEKENEGGRRKKKKKKWNDVGGEEEEKDEEEEEELLEGGRVERGEEVERMWGVGMEDLPRLDGVTDVLAKLQRAAEAARVVERG